MAIKTSLQKFNAIDTGKEETGVWHDFNGDIKLRIRRLSSKISQNARKEAEKPYASQLRAKGTDEEKQKLYDAILVQQIARGVIADWEGVTDEEGKDIPYSGDVAVEVINGPEMKDFRLEVLNLSMDKDSYRAEVVEEAVGN